MTQSDNSIKLEQAHLDQAHLEQAQYASFGHELMTAMGKLYTGPMPLQLASCKLSYYLEVSALDIRYIMHVV